MTEFAPFDENGNISPDSTRAKPDPFGPIEESLRTSKKWKEDKGVIRVREDKKLEQRLAESDAERDILRREVEGLKIEVKVLKDKITAELLRGLQEKFTDAPGLIVAKKLQKDMYLFSILWK